MVKVRPGTPELNEVASKEALHFHFPGWDIIFRSCDSYDFRVPKLYIINGSPVFRELIESVSNNYGIPNGEEPELLPVVKLPESGSTLHSLLTFIFPVALSPILPPTAEKIMELLAVAQKYQMESVLSHIRGAIAQQDPPFIRPETALHIYFLAQRHELRREAVQAARLTLRFSMAIEDLGDKLQFPGMCGAYLHELWKYHKRVRTNLKSGAHEFRNSGLPDDVKGLRCITRRPPHSRSFPQWIDLYIESIAEAPHLFDLIEFENVRAEHTKNESYRSATCSCADISSRVIRAIWEALTVVVNGSIAKVRRTSLTRPHHNK